MSDIESYIRKKAASLGIDPNIAVRVAMSEGGTTDPARQSDSSKNGIREPSYGPFQLLVGGEGTGFPAGMGNDFVRRTGLHPSNPANVYKGIDFALEGASKNGWGAWYGAKKAGIGNKEGIGGLTLNSLPIAAGSPAPAINTFRDVATLPVVGADAAAAPVGTPADAFKSGDVLGGFKALFNKDNVGKLSELSKLTGGGGSENAQMQAHSAPIQTSIGSDGLDASRMATAQQMMTQLVAGRRKKPLGLSLMG
jgi:hypothetical protein